MVLNIPIESYVRLLLFAIYCDGSASLLSRVVDMCVSELHDFGSKLVFWVLICFSFALMFVYRIMQFWLLCGLVH